MAISADAFIGASPGARRDALLALAGERSRVRALVRELNEQPGVANSLARDLALARDSDLHLALTRDLALARRLDRDLALARRLDLDLDALRFSRFLVVAAYAMYRDEVTKTEYMGEKAARLDAEAEKTQPVRFEDMDFVRDSALHEVFVRELEPLLGAALAAIHDGSWPDKSKGLEAAQRRHRFLSDYLRSWSDLPADQAEAERMAFALLGQLLSLNEGEDWHDELEAIANKLGDLDGSDADNETAKQTAIDVRAVMDQRMAELAADEDDASESDLDDVFDEAAAAKVSPIELALWKEGAAERANTAAETYGPPVPVAVATVGGIAASLFALQAGNVLGAAVPIVGIAFGLFWGWLRTFAPPAEDD